MLYIPYDEAQRLVRAIKFWLCRSKTQKDRVYWVKLLKMVASDVKKEYIVNSDPDTGLLTPKEYKNLNLKNGR